MYTTFLGGVGHNSHRPQYIAEITLAMAFSGVKYIDISTSLCQALPSLYLLFLWVVLRLPLQDLYYE
jgi:hypothetical protein